MKLSDDEILRLNRWLHDLEEGQLSDEDAKMLADALKMSEQARRYYVQRGVLMAGLCELTDEAQSANGLMSIRKVDKLSKWFYLSALTCVLMMGLFFWLRRENEAVEMVEARDRGCAILVEAVNAQWGDEGASHRVGMPVAAGRLNLRSGLARLEFYSGASMTLEGPCELEVVSVDEAKCLAGRLRVNVSPHARGFRLVTPDAKVVDLGTEFGLWVDETGKSEVHVFDGEVEVYPEAQTQKVSLTTGQLWDGRAGDSATDRGAEAHAFVELDDLRSLSHESAQLRRQAWRAGMEEVLNDPRLLVGYAFEPETDWGRTLPNSAKGAAEGTHGSIVGARWVQGRWAGKKALQFKSPGDRVRVQVDGELQAITLCAWVSVDGLDRRWNSLFLTDGFQPGNPHWQIENDGRVVLGVRKDKKEWSQFVFRTEPAFGAENMGLWYHLAVTFDLKSGIGRNYVNGKLVAEYLEKGIPSGTRMRIGMAELGNWGLPVSGAKSTEIRNFNGRMDEFLLYREALSVDEVRKIYEMGKPE
ncbi:iron dicitrate transport regulator FecR [Phragmitibacter flavus]|uniref:Iron dicitrate transport regulator FecR n=1 Tax=Phragmitibacter flavus TaxID=2576071 RepID=A0A5R8KG66_9BACT|nr:LamG-like jellyroll fold domain-containing protein [Phragmitibacter flavus]TLD71280.1 iron dicitrate transport regulator FecR [Phragmitibacter flavus]